MKRRKFVLPLLCSLVLFICIIVSSLFVGKSLLRISPADMLLRLQMLRLILKRQMSKPLTARPPEIFKKYILDPIPASVTNIKADQPKNILGYTYTLRFNINRADATKLIYSRPFVRVWNVKYQKGRLHWDWSRGRFSMGISMMVYGWREPPWFKPKLEDNSEAYAFYKVGDRINVQAQMYDRKRGDQVDFQILIYNEKQGEAHFIVSRPKY